MHVIIPGIFFCLSPNNFITRNTSTEMQNEISKRAVEVYVSLSERHNLILGILSCIFLVCLPPFILVKYFHFESFVELSSFGREL